MECFQQGWVSGEFMKRSPLWHELNPCPRSLASHPFRGHSQQRARGSCGEAREDLYGPTQGSGKAEAKPQAGACAEAPTAEPQDADALLPSTLCALPPAPCCSASLGESPEGLSTRPRQDARPGIWLESCSPSGAVPRAPPVLAWPVVSVCATCL